VQGRRAGAGPAAGQLSEMSPRSNVIGVRRRIAIATLITLGGAAWAVMHWATHRAVAGDGIAVPHDAHDPHTAAAGTGYLSTSLSLCLALALVLAATAALQTRSRADRARSLWLFGAVPVLGLLVEVLASSPTTPAGIGAGLVELAPLVLVSLVVQVAVALVALRLAHGILELAEAVARAVIGVRGAATDDERLRFAVERSGHAPSPRLSYAGSQRAPPALQPAF
jgi:hypothetical protein